MKLSAFTVSAYWILSSLEIENVKFDHDQVEPVIIFMSAAESRPLSTVIER